MITIMLLEQGIEASLDACTSNCCKMEEKVAPIEKPTLDHSASYIRAHDLELTAEELAKCSLSDNDGDEQRTDEVVCTINNNNKQLLSLASANGGSGAIMSALVTIGLSEATDESDRWSAVSATDKILRRRAKAVKKGQPAEEEGTVMGKWTKPASGRDVFVWSSKCTRPGHGSDYPVVKSRGLIPASAREAVELIKDSDRVTSYNKMSVGREDQAVLTRDANSSVHCSRSKCPHLGVAGEAKIMSSKSSAPLVRKPLEFKTLFYARQLTEEDGIEMDGAAYITVGRSVWETKEGTADGSDGTTIRCEILLSVNLVREVITEDGEEWCELTQITHAVSPGVPVFIGKQLALSAAETYVKDIRGSFEK